VTAGHAPEHQRATDAVLIRILPKPVTTDPTPGALGLAMPNIGPGNRGAVFLDRIHVGRLLLRTTTHASEGIMRPDFGKAEMAKASQRHLAFTLVERLRFLGPPRYQSIK